MNSFTIEDVVELIELVSKKSEEELIIIGFMVSDFGKMCVLYFYLTHNMLIEYRVESERAPTLDQHADIVVQDLKKNHNVSVFRRMSDGP